MSIFQMSISQRVLDFFEVALAEGMRLDML
jgi:hypothetical protein